MKPTKKMFSSWVKKHLDQWHTRFGQFYDLSVYESMRQQQITALTAQEVYDVERRAYLKTLEHHHMAVIRDRVRDGDFEGMPELEVLVNKLKRDRATGGNIHMFYFITVNVRPDVQFFELKKQVDKYVRRKIVAAAEWVYEQRADIESEMGRGMHLHMLVRQRGDVLHTRFCVDTRNTFKNLVGDPKQHVNMTWHIEAHIPDKRDYMSGSKDSEEKRNKVEIDRVWRNHNHIAHYYTHGDLLPQANADQAQATSDPISPASSAPHPQDAGAP